MESNPRRSSRVGRSFLLGVEDVRGKAVAQRMMLQGISQKLVLFRVNTNRAGCKALKPVERVPLIPVVYELDTCGFC